MELPLRVSLTELPALLRRGRPARVALAKVHATLEADSLLAAHLEIRDDLTRDKHRAPILERWLAGSGTKGRVWGMARIGRHQVSATADLVGAFAPAELQRSAQARNEPLDQAVDAGCALEPGRCHEA